MNLLQENLLLHKKINELKDEIRELKKQLNGEIDVVYLESTDDLE